MRSIIRDAARTAADGAQFEALAACAGVASVVPCVYTENRDKSHIESTVSGISEI
ncbi:MAG: hypothetical protein LBQ88_01920 [Treponema sp.]|nr:hypothetical protein [Treponema sp.]